MSFFSSSFVARSGAFLPFSVLALAFIAGPARADITILANERWGGGSQTINFADPVGQSFTADRTKYQRIGLWINDVNASFAPTDFTIDYDLYAGTGTGGALLDSITATVPQAGFDGYVDVDISHIPFTIGNVYSLIATQDSPRWAAKWSNQSYPDGTGIFQNSPQNYDYGFHAVPEPAAAILISSVAAILLSFWRRR